MSPRVRRRSLAALTLALWAACGPLPGATGEPLPAATTVAFPASKPGVRLSGVLYRPRSNARMPAPAIVIMSGTSGRQGFANWEIPWAQRLQGAGYVALIVDSYTGRGLTFSQHWRLPMSQRAQDALDAATYLAGRPFVRASQIGVIGRSGGGTAVLAAVVERQDSKRSLPFKMAVSDYGYCQDAYGDWKGGTAPSAGPATAYRTPIPLLIAIGTSDTHVPYRSCENLVASAKRAGSPVKLLVFPGADHAFDALYGNATPGQQAEIVNAIADFISAYVAPAPTGTPIRVTASDFVSHVGKNAASLVIPMLPQNASGPRGKATLTARRPQGVIFSVNLAEGSSHGFAQLRQGTCAQIYPEAAYALGPLVNGRVSGTLATAQLDDLMNGHFAVVVVSSPQAPVATSCGNIPRAQ